MSHFAEIKNGIVQRVIVAEQDFINSEAVDGVWVQTSYNTFAGQHPEGRPLRKNFGKVGYIYDEIRDAFYAPQPFPSWTLDEDTCIWQPPVPFPADGNRYKWDEPTTSWTLIN